MKNKHKYILLIILLFILILFTFCKPQEALTKTYNRQLIEMGGKVIIDEKYEFKENIITNRIEKRLGIEGRKRYRDYHKNSCRWNIFLRLNCDMYIIMPVTFEQLNATYIDFFGKERNVFSNKIRNTLIINN